MARKNARVIFQRQTAVEKRRAPGGRAQPNSYLVENGKKTIDFALSQDSVLRKTANLKEGTNWRGRAHSGAALFMFLPGASRSHRRSWAGVRASTVSEGKT